MKINGLKFKSNKQESSGFTIIELMIATIVFSMVLVVLLASFMQIGRMFYKGVSLSNTNEATRTLVEDLVTDVRFFAQTPISCDPTSNCIGVKKYFCVGNNRYTYILGTKTQDSDITNPAVNTFTAGMVRDTIEGCPPPTVIGINTNPKQLLGLSMQLNAMDFVSNSNGVYIHAHVLFYGVDDQNFVSKDPSKNTPALALTAPDAYCEGSLFSTQLCAASDIQTIVQLRE
jgi:prepilin-type N-terminal cleavage/methylation domain-containing protein